MENHNFPSQQVASTQLAERINTTQEVSPAPAASQELQKADEAHEKALKILGEVASGAPKFDESGVMLTPKEQAAELAYRQEHGHSSNETATAR